MADQVEIQLPVTIVPEGTTFTATAYFRTRSTKAASVPTNVYYRVDCLTTKEQLQDWTVVSTAGNVSITMTAAFNAIQDDSNQWERKQLTVMADRGLSTQAVNRAYYKVENVFGYE